MTFKIASWNVNSLRVRLPQVLAWMQEKKPDVLALQEIKLPDEAFPVDAFRDLGYKAIFSGQKTYNGVAILIHEEKNHDERLKPVTDFPHLEDSQRRVLGVTVEKIRILNLYIPNGENPTSLKYQYKLNWLEKLDLFLKEELKSHENYIILGDFNIAPADIDVHDPSFWANQVLFSEPEKKAFQNMQALGFIDCFRELNPDEKSYSWWDYRVNAFKRNLGLRIDHILASQGLSKNCVSCYIDKTPRGFERPSDHAPVVAEFNLI